MFGEQNIFKFRDAFLSNNLFNHTFEYNFIHKIN